MHGRDPRPGESGWEQGIPSGRVTFPLIPSFKGEGSYVAPFPFDSAQDRPFDFPQDERTQTARLEAGNAPSWIPAYAGMTKGGPA